VLIVAAIGLLALSLAGTLSAQQDSALSRQDIQTVQASLTAKGYHPGSADGILGRDTHSAIRQYQRAENLPHTGTLDSVTAAKLGVGPESPDRLEAGGSQTNTRLADAIRDLRKWKAAAAAREIAEGPGTMNPKERN